MEHSHFFEVGTVPDSDQKQEDETPQVEPVHPNPQFFEEGPAHVPTQQQDDTPQIFLMGLEEEERVLNLQGDIEPGFEEQKSFQVTQVSPDPEVKHKENPLALEGNVNLEINQKADLEFQQRESNVYEASVARAQSKQHMQPNLEKESVNISVNNMSQEKEVQLNIVPMASELLRPSWEEARREILQQIMNLNLVPMASELLRPSWEEARIEILQQIIHPYLMPMASELLRPLWTEVLREILQQSISFNNERVRLRISNINGAIDITWQVSTANFVFVEGPPRLLALEGPPRLLALEGPPRLLALEGPPRLLALEGPPFLPALNSNPLLQDSEVHASFPEETEMISELQEKRILVVQGVSEPITAHSCESAEVLAKRPRKIKEQNAKKRKDPFNSRQPDVILRPAELQKLLKCEDQEFSDLGELEFSDPRELLKDLGFGEMEGEGDLEMEGEGDLEMEGEGDLEMEGEGDLEMEGEGDLEMEGEGDLEMEGEGDSEMEGEGDSERKERLPLLLPEIQRPNEEVIEIPEEPDEVAPNAEFPNNRGNHPFHYNGRCRDGEADMESRERQLDEVYPEEMKIFVILLFVGLLFCIFIGTASNALAYKLGWKGNRTLNALTPVADIVFNETTPMNTSIFNKTYSDYNVSTLIHNLSLIDTDMEI